MVTPILMVVSETPSVSDQPAGHFVRSTVQPSGPVSVLPSADLPQWLSVMRLTVAARWPAHSFSHSSIDCGWAAGAVDAVVADAEPVPVVVVLEAAAPPVVVAASLPLVSSPPHAAATSARPMKPATKPVLVRCTGFPPSDSPRSRRAMFSRPPTGITNAPLVRGLT